ncbi:cytochrome P450 [Pterulicium gracile]|uniref:Cytochrome P450 n=1 Tax=Pterulicium gracile TaxID=1884261 RepID=A0A5C3QEZ0_9AGAR|nr:cytochrome P450 [Pterula gracilis]
MVINSRAVAEDLLNKRSANYSDRPFPMMAGTLMNRSKSMFYISYNERCKTYRRLMQQSFNKSAAQDYWGVQEHEARVFVDNLVQSPERLVQLLRRGGNLMSDVARNAAAIIMRIGYGYDVKSDDDHFVTIAEEALRVGSAAGAPGKWMVDSLPWLRFVPEWVPGAAFKRRAREWSKKLYDQSLEPHDFVKKQIVQGIAPPSFTAQLLQPSDGSKVDAERDDIILWTAGALYAAGADTVVSAVKSFFFCMMMNPELQLRAQKEVDAFIATEHRLPNLQDRERGILSFITCMIQETLRWHPASPMGIFHATAKDDVYQGYFIPAKTTVIGNIWAMMHDEEVHPDPDTFDPDRFTGVNGRRIEDDPRDLVFGFGRRVCPGQHLAESSMWMQLVLTLACLDIKKAVDENGNMIEPELGFTTAIVSHVAAFPYQIVPREGEALKLMRQALAAESN